MKAKIFLYITYGIFVGLLATALIWQAASPPRGDLVILLPTPTSGNITVYVSGAVINPGVYTMPAGSRVGDAVNAAGGFAPGAEEDNINLATPLIDGQQIDVPGIVDSGHLNAGRVNINTASVEDLDSLPGIGSTAAQAIVDYRLQNGDFTSTLDIKNVPGIGPATYEKIKDYITVGQ
jgi:competence protein ComEA